MSLEVDREVASLLADCALGTELHGRALEHARSLARLLSVGNSMEQVAEVVLRRLCDGDKNDAARYLTALQEGITQNLKLLFVYVCLEDHHDPKNQKA